MNWLKKRATGSPQTPQFWKRPALMLTLACTLLGGAAQAEAQTRQERMIGQLDRLLAKVAPGQQTVKLTT